MATMLDELNLTDAQAKAIIEKGIEFEAYEGDVPETKKDRQTDAHKLIGMAIDTWVTDGVRPDAEEEDEAEVGKMLAELFELAGVSIDDDGNVEYSEAGDGDGDGDDETFSIDDIVEGYSKMKGPEAVETIEELKEDEDLEWEHVEALVNFENEKARPRKAVLDALEELAGLFESEGGEGEDGEGDGDGEGDSTPDTDEAPWDGYDEASLKDIKATLEEAAEDEEDPLTAEQAEYIMAYEQANKHRKGIVDWCASFIEEQGGAGESEGEGEDDEGVDLAEATREQMEAFIEENELDIKFTKRRQAPREDRGGSRGERRRARRQGRSRGREGDGRCCRQ
jgi:hypothetical protein